MSEELKITEKQRRFCLEYCVDFNGAQAAIRAGYSKKSARQIAQVLLTKDDIKKCVKQIQDKVESEKIMDITEIQQRLTSIARGEAQEDVVVIESDGDFGSNARVIQKKVSAKDQVRALELLGKSKSMFKDNNSFTGDVNVRFNEVKGYMEAVKGGELIKKT